MRLYAIQLDGPENRAMLWEKPALNLSDAIFKARQSFTDWRGKEYPPAMVRATLFRLSELDGSPASIPGVGSIPARHMTKRQARQPVKGQRCPANRTAKAHDPKVKLLPQKSLGERRGLRDCGKCGKADVPMFQSVDRNGYPLAAWYYGRHDAE